MTGGQPVDGQLSVPQIAHQVRSEGVQAIVVMSDDIEKWSDRTLASAGIFPQGVEFLDRRELDRSEEHTSELQSLMRISYAVFCLKKKQKLHTEHKHKRQ